MNNEEFHIGLDDIDDPNGRCTTHFTSLLVELLSTHSVTWIDYPNLIRLNPGIPFRTRGNGAVALRFKSESGTVEGLMPQIERMIQNYVDETYPNTNPGVAVVSGPVPETLHAFSQQALWRTIPIALAQRIINRFEYPHFVFGNGRGLVGALSAVGNMLRTDHTYEYLAYRSLDESDLARNVDVESVIKMDRALGNRVFSNIDDKKRILIEPHGPDPVIYGIRGESADAVIEAAALVKCAQDIERWMVFRTNQATGEHLTHQVRISDLRPYMAAVVQGRVDTPPQIFEGGFVVFSIKDETGMVDCVAYEPTRHFRDIISDLHVGDQVRVHASVRPKSRTHGRTLNLEGIEIIELAPITKSQNPLCHNCRKRMKSAGAGKGFKCVNCGHRERDGVKTEVEIERSLSLGLHLPPLSAQRHLTRPLSRLNLDNSGHSNEPKGKWHVP
jgi:tRNA(Ile2)-agmatinylcytidine synthase